MRGQRQELVIERDGSAPVDRVQPTSAPSIHENATVFILDRDPHALHQIEDVAASAGLSTEACSRIEEFILQYDRRNLGCLVYDIMTPGTRGLTVQEDLRQRRVALPTIAMSARPDVTAVVATLRGGATDFLQKPFAAQALLDSIQAAIDRHRNLRARQAEQTTLAHRLSRLSRREREVLDLVVAGKANKVIALELNISLKTVEAHRSRLMLKVKARCIADLVRFALAAEAASGTAGSWA